MVNVATQDAMTALIRNGGFGGGGMADTYFTRNSSLNWAKQFDTESGALPLVPVGARGSRRRIEEANQNLTYRDAWTTAGTNTIAVVTLASEGIPDPEPGLTWALKVTYADNDLLAQHASLVLTAAAQTGSALVWLPANYDGTGHELEFVSYVGAGSIADGAIDHAKFTQWQTVEAHTTPVGGDLSGEVRVHVAAGAAPTATRFFYLIPQVETSAYRTSMTFGDRGTGYAWDGAAHASTSQRTIGQLAGSATLGETIKNPGAIAFWFTKDHDSTVDFSSTSQAFISQNAGGDSRIEVIWNSATNQFDLIRNAGSGLNTAVFATSYSAGDHTFVVANLGPTTTQLFVNGVAGTAVANTGNPDLSGAEFDIGMRGTILPANAVVGPIALYNHELSLAQIVYLYARGPEAMAMASILA